MSSSRKHGLVGTSQKEEAPGEEGPKRLHFAEAAFQMLSAAENAESVGWDASGTVIEVRHVSTFCELVLPRYYAHCNLSSFVKQLNMYGFETLSATETAAGLAHAFKHHAFLRGQPELLVYIKRKPVRAHKRVVAIKDDDDVPESKEVLEEEITPLRVWGVSAARCFACLEARIRDLEDQNAALRKERRDAMVCCAQQPSEGSARPFYLDEGSEAARSLNELQDGSSFESSGTGSAFRDSNGAGISSPGKAGVPDTWFESNTAKNAAGVRGEGGDGGYGGDGGDEGGEERQGPASASQTLCRGERDDDQWTQEYTDCLVQTPEGEIMG